MYTYYDAVKFYFYAATFHIWAFIITCKFCTWGLPLLLWSQTRLATRQVSIYSLGVLNEVTKWLEPKMQATIEDEESVTARNNAKHTELIIVDGQNVDDDDYVLIDKNARRAHICWWVMFPF